MSEGSRGNGGALVELGIEGYERAVEIGRGGFSVVYRAWDLAFERDVAIKVVSADRQGTEVDRFARECAAIGRLAGHPNIVTVYNAGRLKPGQSYIVMEFLSEGSLAHRVAARPLDWREATDVGVKLAGALDSAHQAGVLHRDVKPGNVMVSSYGECKLGDFGIARLEGRHETQTGKVAASWQHAPPEIVDGARPSAASDVYSLASSLFTLIDGRPPFGLEPAETFVALLARIVRQPVRPIRAPVPEQIERVIREGLAKDPDQRPASAAEFGRRLQAAQAALGVPVTAMPIRADTAAGSSPPETEYVDLHAIAPTESAMPRPVERVAAPADRRWIALAATVILATVLALLVMNVMGGEDDPEDAATTSTSTVGSTTSVASSPVTQSPGPGSTSPLAPTTTASTTATQGVRLGPDLAPITMETCRAPSTATGSAWQLTPLQLSGRTFPFAYSCNLFAGGIGSLDFVLGGSYRQLTTSIGFADGSTSTGHMVRFEFIADGRENLVDPTTLRFGEVRNLQLDLSGVTRLQIRITELSTRGGNEGASRPVVAAPTLTR